MHVHVHVHVHVMCPVAVQTPRAEVARGRAPRSRVLELVYTAPGYGDARDAEERRAERCQNGAESYGEARSGAARGACHVRGAAPEVLGRDSVAVGHLPGYSTGYCPGA